MSLNIIVAVIVVLKPYIVHFPLKMSTGTIYLSQLRDVTKALPGKLPVQIKFRLFPIDCDVRDVLF